MKTRKLPQRRGSKPLDPPSQPSTNTRNGAMLFRMVTANHHEAVVGNRIFTCQGETVTTEARVAMRWSAFDGQTCLSANCRTLNDAKKHCRIAACDDPGAWATGSPVAGQPGGAATEPRALSGPSPVSPAAASATRARMEKICTEMQRQSEDSPLQGNLTR